MSWVISTEAWNNKHPAYFRSPKRCRYVFHPSIWKAQNVWKRVAKTDGWMEGGMDGWMDGNPYCLQKMSKKIHPSIWLDLFLYLFVITSISSCSTSHKCHNTMTNDWFKQFGALAPHGVWSLDARTLARGIPLLELMFEQRQKNTLWWTYKKLLKMAIEIVDMTH